MASMYPLTSYHKNYELDDYIASFYTVASLTYLYEKYFVHIVEKRPDVFSQIEGYKRRKTRLLKPYLIYTLVAVLSDKTLFSQFYDHMSNEEQQLLTTLTWFGYKYVDEMEKKLQDSLVLLDNDERRYFYAKQATLLEKYSFFSLTTDNDRSCYVQDKSNFIVVLGHPIIESIKKALNPPSLSQIQPVAEPPKSTFTFTCETTALQDFYLTMESLLQGLIKFTKSDAPNVPSLRKLQQQFSGGDFFPNDKKLGRLRASILVKIAENIMKTDCENWLSQPQHPDVMRAIFDKVIITNMVKYASVFLDHLENSNMGASLFDKQAGNMMERFYRKFPTDSSWVTEQNIQTHFICHSYHLQLLEKIYFQTIVVIENHRGMTDRIIVTKWNRKELITMPFLRGFAFVLASLGLAEIAYDLPKNQIHGKNKEYLTPFDGLQAVRLTALGKYVMGLSDICPHVAEEKPAQQPVIDDKRLLVTLEHPDPMTQMALDQLMKKVSPRHYVMTYASLLKKCNTEQDLEDKIALFHRVFSAEPPAIWVTFFMEARARLHPMKAEPMLVFKLKDNPLLLQLFAKDPLLRSLTLKVEGRRIALLKSAYPEVLKRLESHGFLEP